MIDITGDGLSATINPLGAELWSLSDGTGRRLLHDGDPAIWVGRAPLLFPIVGGLRDDSYRLDGLRYSMARHGVARRQSFDLVAQEPDRALFRLTDNEATRVAYPFAFQFDAEFSIDGASLTMTLSATNAGEADMPVSMGYHPAFAWPLPYGLPRTDHRILFDAAEPDTLCLLDSTGLIATDDRPSPVDGRMLALNDDIFAQDALIWRHPRSRGCLYGVPGGPNLRVDWSEMPSLGIWTKPGATYVCIEPWDGIADPQGFAGEIWNKPGIHRLGAGESVTHWMRVTLTPS
ncbi:aldose 1-epimerase family protein [Sphingobium nicotianae]|uniref:Aldose 1-epimerase family protein n=1 Tax=Sphingobium nicotianae TaxID=2782607 RepID=A0A9X1DAB4_9SPHN|nr:aldose 1-epimerase family protein [Sphingobium nicotianae]MBT2186311.1 aldose 1-epimerase family protein [Sphingobium nicotianae]